MKAPLLGAALVLAGCPQSIGQQCPPGTAAVGQFTLSFTGEPDAGTACVQSFADGGKQAMTLDDGGTSAGALCYGTGPGAQLSFVAPGKGVRSSALLADGGFHFVGHADPTPGLCNGCAVTVDEAFDGYLHSGGADASFIPQPDGGLPPITGLTGTVVDAYSSDAGGCQCNVPCSTTYAVTGSPF